MAVLPGTTRFGAVGDDAEERGWLLAVAAGDRSALEALYLRYRPRLAGFLRRNTSRHELLDEIINETFWVVWRNASRFRGAARVSTWVIGIAYRCMLKALRNNPPAVAMPEDDDAAICEPRNAAEHELRELRDWVEGGLRQLPRDQRTAIELAYFHGLSCSEIGAVMGCATGTVKAWLFHARTRLRNILPALGGETTKPAGGRR